MENQLTQDDGSWLQRLMSTLGPRNTWGSAARGLQESAGQIGQGIPEYLRNTPPPEFAFGLPLPLTPGSITTMHDLGRSLVGPQTPPQQPMPPDEVWNPFTDLGGQAPPRQDPMAQILAGLGGTQSLYSGAVEPMPRMEKLSIPKGISRDFFDQYLDTLGSAAPTEPEEVKWGWTDWLANAAAGAAQGTTPGEALALAGAGVGQSRKQHELLNLQRQEEYEERMREHTASMAQAGLQVEMFMSRQDFERQEMMQQQAQQFHRQEMLEWEQRQPQVQVDREGNVIVQELRDGQMVVERINAPSFLTQLDIMARTAQIQGANGAGDLLDRTIQLSGGKIELSPSLSPQNVILAHAAGNMALGNVPFPQEFSFLEEQALLRTTGKQDLSEARKAFEVLMQGNPDTAMSAFENAKFQTYLSFMFNAEQGRELREYSLGFMNPQYQSIYLGGR